MPDRIRIALAKGDGIGPEIVDAALDLFTAAGVDSFIEFVPVEMGKAVFDRGDTRGMSDEAISAVEELGILFKGPMGTAKGSGGKSINVTARKLWGAFANLRHFQSLPGVETVYSKAGVPVDFYVVRENIEDTYGGIEHRMTSDVFECKRLMSAPGCDQVHRFAFQTARALGLTKVLCGHKANIMKMTDGIFLSRFRATAEDFHDIETEDVIIDALCMGLVQKPHTYQMVVLPNLQGDIVSDLAAGLVGGLGFAPSANIGNHISIFEAVHGTAPDIAGKGVANPTALILSGLMMLRHIGLRRTAAIIENALLATLESGARTADFGDRGAEPLGTAAFVRRIVDHLGQAPTTIDPSVVPADEAVTFERPTRPMVNSLRRTFETVRSEYVGCDIYLETVLPPLEVARHLERLAEDTPYRLTMISNRGTQVWPSGSVYTELVDYYRVRFQLRPNIPPSAGQAPTLSLLRKVAEKFAVASFEQLRDFDGEHGFSLAQGQ